MSYDFSGLTNAQQWLLTAQGWTVGTTVIPQPSKRTVKKLIERGLVVPHGHVDDRRSPAVRVTEYLVPLDVHLAWCLICGDSHDAA